MSATVALAPNVGSFVAASTLEDGALLAVTLAQGARGDHRVSVYDTTSWRLISSFAAPSAARSGVSRLASNGATLVAADDHTVVAFAARSGTRLWERSFPQPMRVSLLAVADGRVLIQVEHNDYQANMLVLRASDGTDERALTESVSSGLAVAALARDGAVIVVYQESIDVLRPGSADVAVPFKIKTRGAIDAVAVDENGSRVLIGNRSGEVYLADLGSRKGKTVLEMPALVRSVGFHRDAPWALDGDGGFRLLGKGKRGLSLDLDVKTYGGFLLGDGERVALGDYMARTFRVRALSGNEEAFATLPGFASKAVGIDREGGLLVSGLEELWRIDPSSGESSKVGAAVSELCRSEAGDTLLFDGSVRLWSQAGKKPKLLAKAADTAAVCGRHLGTSTNTLAELWDLSTAKRVWRITLDQTWVAETNDCFAFVYATRDGRPVVQLSNGEVWWGDAFDKKAGLVTKGVKGTLRIDPSGRRLYGASAGKITPIEVDGFRKGKAIALPIGSDVRQMVISPSSTKLVAFHQNGRVSLLDLVTRKAVALATGETSAAERDQGELYIVDARTPLCAAFSRDESTVALTLAGGVKFASFASGALTGQLMIATNGRDYLVTDGIRFDWPGAHRKAPIASELVAVENGRPLSHAELLERRAPNLLARLTS